MFAVIRKEKVNIVINTHDDIFLSDGKTERWKRGGIEGVNTEVGELLVGMYSRRVDAERAAITPVDETKLVPKKAG